MLQHIVALILLSLIAIFTTEYTQHGLQLLVTAHDFVSQSLTDVFSGGEAGKTLRLLLALLAVPVAAGLVSILLYWLARRSWFPFFIYVIWAAWLLQVAALAIMFKA